MTGTVDAYTLSTLQRLYFDTHISVEDSPPASNNRLAICPNPAGETLIIEGIPGDADWIYINRADGHLVMTETVSSGKVILNVNRLSPGIYLANASGHSSKFVKQ
ncbi:MAG: T9SS type A sorting domain-containing protein [Lentimicrobiaceae bacterium]|nr:T9SS type A sorting domain-containing protein [Lentimicrobiaceae bacterium]